MNLEAIKSGLIKFIERHRIAFNFLSSRHSQILELAALAATTYHYRVRGYAIHAENTNKGTFRLKATAKGEPSSFSWFVAERSSDVFEIHANLPVVGAYGSDRGVYVVDVGVTRSGWTPDPDACEAVRNEYLVTFVEAKALVVYPMLLAQFVGIVHEIKPTFLGERRPRGFVRAGHVDPTLVSLGYLNGIAESIYNAYPKRGYKIRVIPHFDVVVSVCRRESVSPWDRVPQMTRQRERRRRLASITTVQ